MFSKSQWSNGISTPTVFMATRRRTNEAEGRFSTGGKIFIITIKIITVVSGGLRSSREDVRRSEEAELRCG